MLKKKKKYIINENNIKDVYDDEYIMDKDEQEKKEASGELPDDIKELEEDDEVVVEATTLNKKEEAITDPKELEPLIERWEKAISGEEPIINKKTNEPVTEKYCKEKLSLLKKKLKELQSGSSDSSSDKDKPLVNDLKKTLSKLGFSSDPNNPKVFINKKFNDDVEVGIKIEESSFNCNTVFQNIIYEEAGEVKTTLKIKDVTNDKEVTIEDFMASTDQKILKDIMQKTVNAEFKKQNQTNDNAAEKTDLPDDIKPELIEDGFKKLSDEEKDAVIQYYGKFDKNNKVFKYLQRLKDKKD